MSVCRGCGARIRWAVTEAGKRIPLDPEPRPDGNVHVYDGVAYVLDLDGLPLHDHRAHGDHRLYVSHFATCPQAASFRKKKG